MKVCPRCSELFADDAAYCPEDGHPLERPVDPLIGRVVAGRYRVVKRVGLGGMASVYLARHELIDRRSALKILRRDLAKDAVQRERFLREAKAVNRVNHPNIIAITDFGEADGLLYLVMEYVDGPSLLVHMHRGAFPWQRAVRIGLQLGEALARAHRMGVIHRDLKPENVLLLPGTGGEVVKLTDFGIAKILDAPSLTRSDEAFGTPGYIAPELLEGQKTDARGDLYALGVVLYEMVAAALPFEAGSTAELLVRPLVDAPIPLGSRVSGLPPELEAMVMRLISRRPDDRPRDAFEVCDVLAALVIPSAPGSSEPLISSTETWGEAVSMPTILDARSELEQRASGRPPAAAEAEGLVQLAAHWREALSDLEGRVLSAKLATPSFSRDIDVAEELVSAVRMMLVRFDRAAAFASERQARVDRLDATGREFRARFGRALDVLTRDRSRELVHLDLIAARRRRATLDRRASDLDPWSNPRSDARLWENATLAAEEEQAQTRVRDMSFQVETLEARLFALEEDLERDLLQASAELEGALVAVRRLRAEVAGTLRQASAAVARFVP